MQKRMSDRLDENFFKIFILRVIKKRSSGKKYNIQKKKIITVVNGTNDNKDILKLFKEKCEGDDRDIQQENNGPISEIDGVNNFSLGEEVLKLKFLNLRGNLSQ